MGGDGDGAGAEGAHDQPRRRGDAVRGGDHHVGGGQHRVLARVGLGQHVDAVEQPRAHGRGGAAGDEHGRLPVELGRQPPQRAQEQPQRRALLLVDEGDPQRAFVRRPRERGRAGAQHDVLGREDPLHHLARGLEGGAAGVEPAEEQLDEAARDLRGEHALGGRVERADVERARVAQRDRGGAGRERLVDVDELGRRDGQRLLDRARDVERRGRHRAAAGAGQRQQLADAEDAHGAVGVEQLAAADAAPRLAHEVGIVRRGEHDHAVAGLGLFGGQRADERVDLVLVLPGIRRDLGDGQGLRHGGKRSPGWTNGRDFQPLLTLVSLIVRKP